jgi:hypothetical protein
MFDRVGTLAEQVATNVSRRAFLGRLGQGALGLAALLAGTLGLPGQSRAGGPLCCLCFGYGGSSCVKTTAGKGCRPNCYPGLVDCKQYSICPG